MPVPLSVWESVRDYAKNIAMKQRSKSATPEQHPFAQLPVIGRLFRPNVYPDIPDGGYGWVIVFCCFVTYILCIGIQYIIGIFYRSLLSAAQSSGAESDAFLAVDGARSWMAWAVSFEAAMFFAGAFPTSYIVGSLGVRPTCFIGACILAAGFMAASLSTSLPALVLSFGVVGLGAAIPASAAIVAVVRYFSKRRATATGLAVAGSGVGGIVLGPIVEASVAAYGWRGAMRVLAGISIVMLPAVGLLFVPIFIQPADKRGYLPTPKPHRVTHVTHEGAVHHGEEHDEEEEEEEGEEAQGRAAAEDVEQAHEADAGAVEEGDGGGGEEKAQVHAQAHSQPGAGGTLLSSDSLGQAHASGSAWSTACVPSGTPAAGGCADSWDTGHVPRIVVAHAHAASAPARTAPPPAAHRSPPPGLAPIHVPREGSSRGGGPPHGGGAAHMTTKGAPAGSRKGQGGATAEEAIRKQATFRQKRHTARELLSRPPYLLWLAFVALYGGALFICLGHLVQFFGESDAQLTSSQAASLVSVQGFTNMVGRVSLGFLADWLTGRVSKVTLLACCVGAVGVATLGLAVPGVGGTYPYQFFYMGLNGAFGGSIVSLQAPVTVDLVGLPSLPLAQGLFSAIQAPFVLMGPPAAGAVRQATGDYTAVWAATGTIMVVAACVCALIEPTLTRERAAAAGAASERARVLSEALRH